MKRIKTIDIYGTTYNIEWLDDTIKLDDGCTVEGETLATERVIKISTSHEGNAIPEDEIEAIFYHELIHATFIEGQYLNCSDDEPLVEWLAKNLRNFRKQKIFDNK